MTRERVELRCHTNSSLLDGVSKPRRLIDRARKLNMTALAVTDRNSACAYPLLDARTEGTEFKVIYGTEVVVADSLLDVPSRTWEEKLWVPNVTAPITVLAKDQAGIQAIYRLLTAVGLNHGPVDAYVNWLQLERDRAHLLVGSGTEWLPALIAQNAAEAELLRVAHFFDYIEVAFDEKPETVQVLLALGAQSHRPVVAVGKVRYATEEERAVYDCLASCDADSPSLHLRSTAQMLACFDYLPSEVAQQIVVDDPCAIAAQVEADIRPVKRDWLFSDAHYTAIVSRCFAELPRCYGTPPPVDVCVRLQEELDRLATPQNVEALYAAMTIADMAMDDDVFFAAGVELVGSLVAYLLGLTGIDPIAWRLPLEGMVDSSVAGSACVTLQAEQRIGMLGISIADRLVEEFGRHHVFGGNERVTLSQEDAQSLAEQYVNRDESLPIEEAVARVEELTFRLLGADVNRGSQPDSGKIFLIPEGYSVYDFTPVIAGKECLRTHMLSRTMHSFLPWVELEMDFALTLCGEMSVLADGLPPLEPFKGDAAVLRRLCEGDTTGIPTFESAFCWEVRALCTPKNVEELLKMYVLCRREDMWRGCMKAELRAGRSLSQIAVTQEDVLEYLLAHGVPHEAAWRVSRLHHSERAQALAELHAPYALDDWWVATVGAVHACFPARAWALCGLQKAWWLAWYKEYTPDVFEEVLGYADVWRDLEEYWSR